MGTNYYVKSPECPNGCMHCERMLHIGKRSMGWEFSFQAYPEHNLKSYRDWKAFTQESTIYDEYGDTMDPEPFFEKVVDASKKVTKNPVTGEMQTPINHVQWQEENPQPFGDKIYWLDEDGWSLTNRYFS